ncbi:MAG: GNAT family N-acetyltransferase, partial [Brasilonema sp.]
NMQFQFHPLTRSEATELISWRYDKPLDFYNIQVDIDVLQNTVDFFIDPANSYFAISSQKHDFTAFCCFGADAQVPGGGDYSLDALDIGLGIRPEFTGQGLGSRIAIATIDYARQWFSPQRLRVTIAAFNKRALKVWQNLAFVPVERFRNQNGGNEYLIFIRDA